MKITIATGLYPPEIGGPATYATMLEKELPALGFVVKVVPFGLVRHYPKVIRHLVYTWRLWRESKKTDVIYALDPTSVGLPALVVSWLRKKPFLVRLGGDYAWEQGRYRFGLSVTLDEYLDDKESSPWPVRILACIQSFVVSRARLVIVPSHYLKGVVTKWGIDENRIRVIYSALFPISVADSKEVLKRELSFAYPTIVTAGRLVPWKGFKVLIDVIAKLQVNFPNISLVIAGNGEERDDLQNHVADLKLSQHVRFMGNLSKEALGATIKASDVFVLNTAYEGLSHQLIEVMDIGTPIVTTRVGGNPELITDGADGYLVEFNNEKDLLEAITRVLNHPESCTRIVQSARGRSKQFSKDIVIKQIDQMLREIS
ncbi:glycosyltransferase family 4 protein [Candidatus Kaiserbacteria bacterium]|nr:glycosyltransferase family 4 protein [Candidatus Kaiserbacteria bacterium]